VPIQDQTRRKYWRLFRTPLGNPIIKNELAEVARKSLVDYSNIRAAMKEVEREGIRGTKQIEDEIRQIEAEGEHGVTYRLLFAVDGHIGQILVGLVLLNKKTQQTPRAAIDLAQSRLRTWRDNAPS
jgi:phage-related protein